MCYNSHMLRNILIIFVRFVDKVIETCVAFKMTTLVSLPFAFLQA